MEERRKEYPLSPDAYELCEEIGRGASTVVYRAKCRMLLDQVVAIKVIDMESSSSSLICDEPISEEVQTMALLEHPNVLSCHCSFANGDKLWTVMPYMAGGSCLSILRTAHPSGFKESVVATVLREVLKGLEYLHTHAHIHGDVKAGNILLDLNGEIKLCDVGGSSYLSHSGDRRHPRNAFVRTPCWMAPEGLDHSGGYHFKADIWSFGMTALELASGSNLSSNFSPKKIVTMTWTNSLPVPKEKSLSKCFKDMVATCLEKDPSKRPSAQRLLKDPFFMQGRSADYVILNILEGLPPLGDRIQALKEKERTIIEEDLQQVVSKDGGKKGLSRRRNLTIVPVNPSPNFAAGGQFVKKGTCSSEPQTPHSSARLETCSSEPETPHSSARLESFRRRSASMNGFICRWNNYTESSSAGKVEERRRSESNRNNSCSSIENRGSSSSCTSDVAHATPSSGHQCQGQCSGTSPQAANGFYLEALRASAEHFDTKTKGAVFQQKGRFKVTSEDVDVNKAPPQPRYHGVQGACQHPTSCNTMPCTSVLQHYFRSLLHSNIIQRDSILKAMKLLYGGDLSANGSVDGITNPLLQANISERTLLEIAHEEERELAKELDKLQKRTAFGILSTPKYNHSG